MNNALVAGIVSAGLFLSPGSPAKAQEGADWAAGALLFGAQSKEFAKGPVWSGDVTFTSVTPGCASAASSFTNGSTRKVFLRPFRTGKYLPAIMMVFPDGAFIGVARSPSKYGAVGINRSVWMFTTPTNDNDFSLRMNPKPTHTTPQFHVTGAFKFFFAVAGCRVQFQGTLHKVH